MPDAGCLIPCRSKEFELEHTPHTIRNKYFTVELQLKAFRSEQHPLFQETLNEAECCILTVASHEVFFFTCRPQNCK
jgi:hypothetical protein